MQMKLKFITYLIVAIFCVSCVLPEAQTQSQGQGQNQNQSQPPAQAEPTTSDSPGAGFTLVPTLTENVISTSEPALEPTGSSPCHNGESRQAQSPYVPFTIATTVENAVLRAGPGALFNAKTTLALNSQLTVIGVAPGCEWIFVITTFDTTGWVFAGLLEVKPELAIVPLIQPADVQLVRGQVLGPDRHPITGIQFALIEGVGATGTPPRTDAVTDSNGIFYAFLPLTAAGTWTVSYTAIACTSNLMNANCQCITGDCGKPDPEITTVSLPATGMLTFGWK
jgi:hypothetical protein